MPREVKALKRLIEKLAKSYLELMATDDDFSRDTYLSQKPEKSMDYILGAILPDIPDIQQ